MPFYGSHNYPDTIGGTLWFRPKDPLRHRYHWFDSPTHADPHKKLWWMFKRAGFASFCYSAFTCYDQHVMFSNDPGKILFHFVKTSIPWMGISMCSAATIITLATIRRPHDDKTNYFFGAFLGSFPVTSAWNKSTGWGAYYSVFIGAIALVAKHLWDMDSVIIPRGSAFYAREINIVTGGSLGEGDYTFGWGVPERERVPQKN